VKIADLSPPTYSQSAFDLYALNRIVDETGCYCLTNAGSDILYVGQALSIRQRLIQHFDSEKKVVLTIYGRVSQAWWRAEASTHLAALERGWLEMIRLRDGQLPPLNRMSGHM
jgi:predicted GIY-YIG superfamily endonuclease